MLRFRLRTLQPEHKSSTLDLAKRTSSVARFPSTQTSKDFAVITLLRQPGCCGWVMDGPDYSLDHTIYGRYCYLA
jgi:hypothetical protein